MLLSCNWIKGLSCAWQCTWPWLRPLSSGGFSFKPCNFVQRETLWAPLILMLPSQCDVYCYSSYLLWIVPCLCLSWGCLIFEKSPSVFHNSYHLIQLVSEFPPTYRLRSLFFLKKETPTTNRSVSVQLKWHLWIFFILCGGRDGRGKDEGGRRFSFPAWPAGTGVHSSQWWKRSSLGIWRQVTETRNRLLRLLESTAWLILGTTSCQQATDGWGVRREEKTFLTDNVVLMQRRFQTQSWFPPDVKAFLGVCGRYKKAGTTVGKNALNLFGFLGYILTPHPPPSSGAFDCIRRTLSWRWELWVLSFHVSGHQGFGVSILVK